MFGICVLDITKANSPSKSQTSVKESMDEEHKKSVIKLTIYVRFFFNFFKWYLNCRFWKE